MLFSTRLFSILLASVAVPASPETSRVAKEFDTSLKPGLLENEIAFSRTASDSEDVVITLKPHSIPTNQPPLFSDSRADEHGIKYWNFFCYEYRPRNENEENLNLGHIGAVDCCRAIRRSASNAFNEEQETLNLYNACFEEISAIPPIFTQDVSAKLPQFSFFWSELTSSAIVNKNASKLAMWSTFQSPPLPAQNEALQSKTNGSTWIWNDVAKRGFWHGKLVEHERLELMSSLVRLESTLSETGGMHRELLSKIEVKPPTKDSSCSVSSLYILFLLPRHLFVNVEDMFTDVSVRYKNFQNESTQNPIPWKASLLQSKSKTNEKDVVEVIDQEEPSFSSKSRSHALIIHLERHQATKFDEEQIQNTSQLTLILEFATKLHVRYPPLTSHYPSSSNRNFWLLAIAPPEVISGELTCGLSKPATRRLGNLWDEISSREMIGDNSTDENRFFDFESSRPDLILLWIAAGNENHYGLVLLVTAVVALAGALQMLRDIHNSAP